MGRLLDNALTAIEEDYELYYIEHDKDGDYDTADSKTRRKYRRIIDTLKSMGAVSNKVDKEK